MEIETINQEVLFTKDRIIKLKACDIDFLIEKARVNKRKRIRLCTHDDIDSKLHEMIIVHPKDVYVRPHRHIEALESLHVIRGVADFVMFDDQGKVYEVFRLSQANEGKTFYHRTDSAYCHSLIVRSEFFVFHEIKTGPYKKEDTIFASWAPDEDDSLGIATFRAKIQEAVDEFLKRKR